MISFLSIDVVMEIHDVALARFGGEWGLRDRGLLESAVAQPEQSFGGEYLHEDLFAMAAAYAFHIAENQPFVDGNKRTGAGAALVFLDLNGYDLGGDEATELRLYDALIAIAEHRLDRAGLALVLRQLAGAVQ